MEFVAEEIAKIVQKFNLTKDLFEFEEQSSDQSASSVVYISSDDEKETSDSWDSEWSTDTEAIIDRTEREVNASPILIGGRILTTENSDDEMQPGPSGPLPTLPTTPKLRHEYFDRDLCYAPSKKLEKYKIELCSTILPIPESPMLPPEHERGPSQGTPLLHSSSSGFHASYHIQNVQPYANLSNERCFSSMVCGRSVDEIKQQKTNWYMERSTPNSEPAYKTNLRRESYENGLNAGSLLFLASAVLQSAIL